VRAKYFLGAIPQTPYSLAITALLAATLAVLTIPFQVQRLPRSAALAPGGRHMKFSGALALVFLQVSPSSISSFSPQNSPHGRPPSFWVVVVLQFSYWLTLAQFMTAPTCFSA